MLMLLVLVSVLTAARADCDACIQGVCHSKKVLIEGFPITDQLAIDRTNNILYVQLNYSTTAFFLDEGKIRAVHAENTTGLAVDQDTHILYASLDGFIYAYRYQQGGYTKDRVFLNDRQTTPTRLRYEDTLYTINEDGSSAYYSKTSNSFAGYENLENFGVTDMANVKGKDGDVYFGDSSEKVIKKIDRNTMELVKYASYVDGSVEDFVFDRDEKIVFLDADGSVARWEPTREECVEPHRIGADLRELYRNDHIVQYTEHPYIRALGNRNPVSEDSRSLENNYEYYTLNKEMGSSSEAHYMLPNAILDRY